MVSTPASTTNNGSGNGKNEGTGGNVDFEPSTTLEIEAGGEPEFEADPEIESARGGRARAAFRALDEKTAHIRGQVTDKARTYAAQGKDKATDALDDFVNIVEDAARSIDDRVGAQYGDYARRAAQAVSGLSTSLRDKDVDELFDDARDAVRKSPAVAVGAAVAVGFVLARLVKAGMSDEKGGKTSRKRSGTKTASTTKPRKSAKRGGGKSAKA